MTKGVIFLMPHGCTSLQFYVKRGMLFTHYVLRVTRYVGTLSRRAMRRLPGLRLPEVPTTSLLEEDHDSKAIFGFIRAWGTLFARYPRHAYLA